MKTNENISNKEFRLKFKCSNTKCIYPNNTSQPKNQVRKYLKTQLRLETDIQTIENSYLRLHELLPLAYDQRMVQQTVFKCTNATSNQYALTHTF